MSHLLIIQDSSGKELARVPVGAGWTFREEPLPKKAEPKAAAQNGPDKDLGVGDLGKGRSKTG